MSDAGRRRRTTLFPWPTRAELRCHLSDALWTSAMIRTCAIPTSLNPRWRGGRELESTQLRWSRYRVHEHLAPSSSLKLQKPFPASPCFQAAVISIQSSIHKPILSCYTRTISLSTSKVTEAVNVAVYRLVLASVIARLLPVSTGHCRKGALFPPLAVLCE
jgi:hypothetical protein